MAENNKSVAQVAREMDVNENTLYNWIKNMAKNPR
ncbi:transposase [Priestia flexa]